MAWGLFEQHARGGKWSLYTTSKNRLSISGLVSGTEYFFRVIALGAAGESPVSDVTSAKAA